jgi:hypothetical protein
MFRGKLIGSFRFSHRREYIGGSAASGTVPGGLTPWWRGQGLARAALGCVARSCPPSVSALDSDSCSGKIGGLAFVSSNSENISRVAFLKHKNNRKQETGTMASR